MSAHKPGLNPQWQSNTTGRAKVVPLYSPLSYVRGCFVLWCDPCISFSLPIQTHRLLLYDYEIPDR